MRPTDENQHGSTRPNLMSASRPGGGEDNILAMLERDAGRGGASQFSSHPRKGWYAGAGLLVMAMVGALGWLAWENANKVPEVTVETTLVLPSGETSLGAAHDAPPAPVAALAEGSAHLHAAVSVSPAAAPAYDAPPVPADPAPAQTAGAAIVDSPAPTAEAPVMLAQAAASAPEQVQPSRLPPLVLLPPEELGTKRAPTASAPAPDPTKAAAAKPAQEDAAPAAQPVARVDSAPRPASKAKRKPATRIAAKADLAPAARMSGKGDTPVPARASAKARGAAKTALARAKKAPARVTTAAPSKAPDAGADGDVALISAIIMHSSRHAGERAKADAAKGCDGPKCPAKPAAR